MWCIYDSLEKVLLGVLTILENENFREDSLLEKLEKYNNREYIQEFIDMYQKIELNINDSF